MKCLVRYKGATIISDVIDIFNYKEEQFSASIVSNVNPSIIFTSNDVVTLTCEVKNENPYKKDVNYNYQWIISNKTIENYNKNTINIKDSLSDKDGWQEEKDSDGNIVNQWYELSKDFIVSIGEIKCEVTISRDSEEISKEIAVTETEVKTVVGQDDISVITRYKYYISSFDNVSFSKAVGKDGNWNGDWIINNGNVSWENADSYQDIPTIKNNNYYLYYTYQNVWKEGSKELKTENWALPRMLRGVTASGNQLSEAALAKINTFNDLTMGGEEQGMYLEDVYYPTQDKTPQSGKTYYTISGQTNGKPIYIKFNGSSFEEGVIYY